MQCKEFVVFAGVNGAGKTSIYNEMFKKHAFNVEPRINPDEMIHSFRATGKVWMTRYGRENCA